MIIALENRCQLRKSSCAKMEKQQSREQMAPTILRESFAEQTAVQYLTHLLERYAALIRINELCKTPSDRHFLQGKINLCSSAKSSNQDVETILRTLNH